MSNDFKIGTVERAFQLARTGACHSVVQIRNRLNAEGYDGVHGHLTGSTIQRQLREAFSARGISGGTDDDAGPDAE